MALSRTTEPDVNAVVVEVVQVTLRVLLVGVSDAPCYYKDVRLPTRSRVGQSGLETHLCSTIPFKGYFAEICFLTHVPNACLHADFPSGPSQETGTIALSANLA